MTEERPPEPVSDDTTAVPTPPPAAAPPPAVQPPAYTRPTSTPPAAAPQPTVAWAPPPTTTVAAGRRTTLSLAAGILLVLLGLLGVLASLAALTIGREVIRQFDFSAVPGLERVDNPTAFVESILTFGAIFVLVCSAFYVIGGVGVMRSANWGRVIGIVIGILVGLLWLVGLTNGGRGDSSFPLVLVLIHAYIAISLLFFWRTRTPA
jgi:hypothetical protein